MDQKWAVDELHDPEMIRGYLNADRLYAAYALGDLEPSLFPQCRWWRARRTVAGNRQEWALVLCFTGLTPHAIVCLGEPAGVGAVLAWAPLSDEVYLVCREEHMVPAGAVMQLPEPRHMARMFLEAGSFRPVPTRSAVRLTLEQLDQLRVLYALDPAAADAFAPYQLADGVFYGIERGGQLVCVAGTHLVAPTEQIGAVGNIVTHPGYRRQGMAAACTSAVCADLLARELTVVLNVGTENTPAMRLYQQLGFEEYCTYYETVAIVDKERVR